MVNSITIWEFAVEFGDWLLEENFRPVTLADGKFWLSKSGRTFTTEQLWEKFVDHRLALQYLDSF